MRNHIEWLDKVTRGDSNREIARRAEGVSDATLSRQRRAGELSADLIIKIAEAYNESPVVALVDLGFMSAKWITEPGVITALSRASDEELTDELLRRLNLLSDKSVDELAEQRKLSALSDADDMNDGTVRPFDYGIPHAADSSIDEDAERESRGEDLID